MSGNLKKMTSFSGFRQDGVKAKLPEQILHSVDFMSTELANANWARVTEDLNYANFHLVNRDQINLGQLRAFRKGKDSLFVIKLLGTPNLETGLLDRISEIHGWEQGLLKGFEFFRWLRTTRHRRLAEQVALFLDPLDAQLLKSGTFTKPN